METKRTPGPWGLSSETPTIIKAYDEFGETNVIIGSASGYKGSPYFPSDEASVFNAQLIAAAPELLDALRDVVEIMGSNGLDECDAYVSASSLLDKLGAA